MHLKRGNGSAELTVSASNGRSSVTRAWARSPLAILTPRASGPSVWACTSNYGGGMLGGDQTSLKLELEKGACCFLSTQASTKIYRNPHGLPCSHRFEAKVEEDATLISAPDPVQCFAEATFQQRQIFSITPSSNLVLVDWLSAGRTARGERWAFSHFSSRIEIYREIKLLLLDNLILDPQRIDLSSRFGLGSFNVLATVILLGPKVEPFAKEMLTRIGDEPLQPQSRQLCSVSPLHEGAILRLAGESVEEVGRSIAAQLRFTQALLKDDPWLRKW